MVSSLPEPLRAWCSRHLDRFGEVIALIAAFWANDAWSAHPPLPIAAQALTLAALLLAPSPVQAPSRSRFAYLGRRVAIVGAVAALAAGVIVVYFNRGADALAFIPLWLGGMAAFQVLCALPVARWIEAMARQRNDLLLTDAVVWAACLHLGASFWRNFWPGMWPPIATIALWCGVLAVTGWHRLPWPRLGSRFLVMAAVFAALVYAAGAAIGHRPHAAFFIVYGWGAVALLLHRWLVGRGILSFTENLRCAALLVAGLWLMRGVAVRTVHGTGDAVWYATTLADAVQQLWHGYFPIYAGQSEYLFNGAVFPIRIAPAFHHLGLGLDLLTFHSLGIAALQNLLLTLIGLTGLFSAYLSLRALAPARPGIAAGLAELFLACPGVLGLAYNSDLYMSWTTLPLVPLAFWAALRAERQPDRLSFLVLGGATGLLWWGHSPIAMWTIVAVGLVVLVQQLRRWRDRASWRRAGEAAAVFIAVGAYPMASVLFFPLEPGVRSSDFMAAAPGTIVQFLHGVQTAVFLPMSAIGRELGDFQLGYALWALLIALLIVSWRRGVDLTTRVLVIIAIGFALLLDPLPGVGTTLWSLVPAIVRNATGNWAMNRLYLTLAACVAFGTILAVARGIFETPRRRSWLIALLALGVAWSTLEAGKYARGSKLVARPSATADSWTRPENIIVSRHAYMVFTHAPATFTHGTTDPALEERLYARDTGALLADNQERAFASAKIVDQRDLTYVGAAARDVAIAHAFTLQPHERYLLRVESRNDPSDWGSGTLKLSGPSLLRIYALPEYGGERSFGLGGNHLSFTPVWTSLPEAEPIDVSYFATDAVRAAGKDLNATLTLLRYDPATLPVRVTSWMPYRAEVSAAKDAWLETPRMFQQGYAAKVNGAHAALKKGPDGLVRVAVPAGESKVELKFIAPLGLQAFFWISFATILALLAAGIRAIAQRVNADVSR